jgi:hypothetical protein
MKRTVIGILVAAVLLASAYAGDYLWVRYRMAKGLDPMSTVTIETSYAIHKKDGKTEYDFAAPQTQVCIRAMFPHFGYEPCWYLNRHTQNRIDI